MRSRRNRKEGVIIHVHGRRISLLDELHLEHILHESTEKGFETMWPGSVSLEVPNPYSDINTMFIDFKDDTLVLTVGDRQDSYQFYDFEDSISIEQAEKLISDIRGIVSGQKCHYTIISNIKWLSDGLIGMEEMDSPAYEFCRGKSRGNYLFRYIEMFGGKIDYRFWDPEMNLVTEFPATRKTLFAYSMVSEYDRSYFNIYVTDEDSGNVVCTLYEINESDPRENLVAEEKLTVRREIVERIVSVVRSNPDLLCIRELPVPGRLNGTLSDFVFSDGGRINMAAGYNISYWLDHEPDDSDTRLVMDSFSEIRRILIEEGVDEKYLMQY